jgi:hypothetical protein
MRWTVETSNSVVDAEIEALPKDMRARLVRLANVIEQVGFEGLPFSSVKHLDDKLWELRFSGRDGIPCDLRYRFGTSRGDLAGVRQENAKNADP